jgi:DNA-binding MarR family transcriptional regulator
MVDANLDTIRTRLKKIMKLVHMTHVKNMGVSELSNPQWWIVRALMEKGRLTIGQLSSVLMVTNATVSGHIDNLEKLGIVSRVRSEKDRRIVNVEVNEEFAMKMKGESEEVHDSFNKLFEDLTKEEVNKIFIGLDILERTLEGGNDDETN